MLQGFDAGVEGKQLAGQVTFLDYLLLISPVAFGNFGEVAHPLRGNDVDFCTGLVSSLEVGRQIGPRFFHQNLHHFAVQAIHTGIVELGSDGTKNGHVLHCFLPQLVGSLVLFFDIAQGIQRAAFIKFVDGNHVGVIDHVDFFQLGCRTVFGGHHVEGNVGMVHNFGIRLANARGLQDDQVVLSSFEDIDCVGYIAREGQIGLAGRQGTHVHPGIAGGVHADAVAE